MGREGDGEGKGTGWGREGNEGVTIDASAQAEMIDLHSIPHILTLGANESSLELERRKAS